MKWRSSVRSHRISPVRGSTLQGQPRGAKPLPLVFRSSLAPAAATMLLLASPGWGLGMPLPSGEGSAGARLALDQVALVPHTGALVPHTVEVDGHPMAVWEKSPADPRGTIVLIHGRTWSSLPDFDLQVPGEDLSLMDGLVAEGYATYAVDLRGYGGTPRDETGWLTPDRAARDVEAVLRWVASRTGDRAVLFGWSYGSVVAQLTAQRVGEGVAALVLFGYPVGPDTDFSSPGPVPDQPPRVATTARAAASDFLIPGSISQPAIDEYVRHALAADPVRMDWRNLEEWRELDPAKVRVPTLLLQGEKDPFAPTDRQAAFFSRLGTPDRSWVTIAGGDHAAHLETARPRFLHALVGFLRQPR